jgi:polysaccharide deacetylase family protein (PEP-CTERM system associated)
VFTFTRAEFAEDIRKARAIIEDCAGVAVTGYRAPSFSIDQRTSWAFAELAEQGYAYSSSVAPVVHDHYGWPEAPRFAFRPLPWSKMIELPVTTAMLGGRRVAAGGGGFFRVLPYAFSRWAIRQVNRDEGRPAMFYFHPWEVDPDQPRVPHAPLRSRLRHYTGLSKMADKLSDLVHEFRWGRMDMIAHREAARAGELEPLELTPDAAL